jgi:serine/threonine protein kinase
MKPSNWDQLQDIYHEALAKPKSERSAFVENACAGDPELLRQINSLLKANDLSDDILKAPVLEINSAPGDLVGTTIGERYFVEKELGAGGMSHVYLARALNLQNYAVVIKVLSHTLVQDQYALQKFEQEVEALLRMNDPNVVRVLDTGKLPDDRPYIVMAYVEGETLRSQLTEDGIDLKRAASILKQIGTALAHVHEKDVFHRDLKPENIILKTGTDSVVLVDFGIAKVKDSLIAPTTVTGVSAGTLGYMSPEQLRGEEITAASDIYSMGVIAYEMIFGRKPFDPASTPDLLDLQRKGVGKLPQKVSTKAQHIIRRALSFVPKYRYRNAKEFGDKLADALLTPAKRVVDLSIVAKAFGGLLILALLSFVIYKCCVGPGFPRNHFTYWLMVQDGKDSQEPFKSNGEETFDNGDKFQLNVLTPTTAYLYVMKEGPPGKNDVSFQMIFPNQGTNNGSASLGANQTIQTDWFTFQGSAGDENFWMVWSITPVNELESAKLEAFKHFGGGLTDPTLTAVKEFLRTKQLEHKVTVYHYKESQLAIPRGKNDLLVVLAQFKHH